MATNLFLTASSADAAVTAGSGTKWKADFTPGASSTHLNKNGVAGPTAPLQLTDGAAGTDGTVVSFYTPPLRAVTIAGAITCTMWDRENATANNVAPTIRIERTSGDGTVSSTIVSETTNHGAGEMPTTAGGATDTITCSAANVTDTTLSDGDRLRITLWIDDANSQGGTGNMASGGRGEFWVNGPVGSAGQARLAFTEQVQPLAGPDLEQLVESTRGTTNPQTVTLSGASNGDTIYAFAGGDGGLGDSNHVSAVAFSTTAGTTGTWSTVSQQLPSNGADTPWLSIGKVAVTATGSVTVSVNRTQGGTARTWHLFGVLVRSSAGEEVATKYTSNSTQVVNTAIAEGSAVIVYWADWDAGTVGTPTPNTPTILENSSDTNYTENFFQFTGQASGTRDYGTTGASGANIRLHALEILAPSTGTNASAENAAVTAAANPPAAMQVAPGSGVANVGATANQPTIVTGVNAPAGNAGATAAALGPSVRISGTTGTAAVSAGAQGPSVVVKPGAGVANVGASANDATVSTASSTNAAAEVANVGAAANAPGGAVQASAGSAAVTAAGLTTTSKVAPGSQVANVGAAAEAPTVVTGSFAYANAQVANVGAAALAPGGSVLFTAQNAAVAAAALQPGPSVRTNAGQAAVTAAGLLPTRGISPGAGSAGVTVIVQPSSQRVLVGAELASISAAAGAVTMGIPDTLALSAGGVSPVAGSAPAVTDLPVASSTVTGSAAASSPGVADRNRSSSGVDPVD